MSESSSPKTEVVKADRGSARADLVQDCRIMLRYALREGKELPADLCRKVALMARGMEQAGLAPLCDVPPELLARPAGSAQPRAKIEAKIAEPGTAGETKVGIEPQAETAADGIEDGIDRFEVFLQVYAGLSRAVTPATAETLMATEAKGPGRWRFSGLPIVIQFAAVVAAVAAVTFALGSLPKAKEESQKGAAGSSSSSSKKGQEAKSDKRDEGDKKGPPTNQ